MDCYASTMQNRLYDIQTDTYNNMLDVQTILDQPQSKTLTVCESYVIDNENHILFMFVHSLPIGKSNSKPTDCNC